MPQTIEEIMTSGPRTVDAGASLTIVSLGDLAQEREPDSALADISSASPDQ